MFLVFVSGGGEGVIECCLFALPRILYETTNEKAPWNQGMTHTHTHLHLHLYASITDDPMAHMKSLNASLPVIAPPSAKAHTHNTRTQQVKPYPNDRKPRQKQ